MTASMRPQGLMVPAAATVPETKRSESPGRKEQMTQPVSKKKMKNMTA